MAFDIWLSFAAASLIVLITPGPTIVLVVSYALSIHRKAVFAMIAGVGLGDLVAMLVSLIGLGAILAASATAFTVMKWAGAAYLVYLGVRMIRTAPSAHLELAPLATGVRPATTAFRDATIVTMLNPKSIGFFIAFVPQFLDPAAPMVPQASLMLVTFVGLGVVNALAYAWLAVRFRDRIKQPHILPWLQRAGGAVLIGLAAFTATLRQS